MMKAIGFIFILISLLLLIKYFDRQRDHFDRQRDNFDRQRDNFDRQRDNFDRQRDNFSVDHNLYQQDFRPKPMGTAKCQGNGKSRGQVCTSTFVPKTDEDRSMEVNYKKT
jgi:hypothetical protein